MSKIESLEFLKQELAVRTVEGQFYEKLEKNAVRCFSCGHRCKIPEGQSGICKVRFNQDGILRVPFGYTAGMNCDPIEKKPFFHVVPGSLAMSFGMVGCDYHCSFCQNWISSQVLRDTEAYAPVRPITAKQIVEIGLRNGARIVTSTYNEPLITSEWAMAVFAIAKECGLHTSYVSNGNGAPEVIEALRSVTDLYKIDLKSFRDKNYRAMGGRLQTVLDTIQLVHSLGFWMELVTLVVPGMNDSKEELQDMAQFIASISLDIPWHVTAFHDSYKMKDRGRTSLRSLLQAGEIGKDAGLHFVYLGNVPGFAPEWETTYCQHCNTPVVEREGYHILQNRVTSGNCPSCGSPIPGVWN